jgi:hypothetical protein
MPKTLGGGGRHGNSATHIETHAEMFRRNSHQCKINYRRTNIPLIKSVQQRHSPALKVCISVSRVGGKAQKNRCERLPEPETDHAQYRS